MKIKIRKKINMYTFVMIKNTRRRSLCKPLEIEFNNNFFLCKLLRAVTMLVVIADFSTLFDLRFLCKSIEIGWQ